MREKLVEFTSVGEDYKYGDWFTTEIMEFVRDVKSEKDALWNLKSIMKSYESRKSFKERLLNLIK